MLISIETYRTYNFPGGGGGSVRTPYPPSGSAHAYDRSTCDIFSKANLEGQDFSSTGSFSIARATSDTSKHDEVYDCAIFYLVLH